MRHQLSFFATKSDLESLLRSLEAERRFQFVLTGIFDSPDFEPMASLFNTLDLGKRGIVVANSNQLPAYLVAPRETTIQTRPIPQCGGESKYAIDQLANPTTIVFRPGGYCGQQCLIAGQVGTVSDHPSSIKLFHAFAKHIRHQFAKIKSFYVGKEAEELLDKGWRLTHNAKSPVLYDLKRD